MQTIKKLIKIAEDLGWTVYHHDENDPEYEFSQTSPKYGQDFNFTLRARDYDAPAPNNPEYLINELDEYVDNYDPSEEAMLWIKNGHGCAGAPDDPKDVIDDMEDCKQMMQDLLDAWQGNKNTVKKLSKDLKAILKAKKSKTPTVTLPDEKEIWLGDRLYYVTIVKKGTDKALLVHREPKGFATPAVLIPADDAENIENALKALIKNHGPQRL